MFTISAQVNPRVNISRMGLSAIATIPKVPLAMPKELGRQRGARAGDKDRSDGLVCTGVVFPVLPQTRLPEQRPVSPRRIGLS